MEISLGIESWNGSEFCKELVLPYSFSVICHLFCCRMEDRQACEWIVSCFDGTDHAGKYSFLLVQNSSTWYMHTCVYNVLLCISKGSLGSEDWTLVACYV